MTVAIKPTVRFVGWKVVLLGSWEGQPGFEKENITYSVVNMLRLIEVMTLHSGTHLWCVY